MCMLPNRLFDLFAITSPQYLLINICRNLKHHGALCLQHTREKHYRFSYQIAHIISTAIHASSYDYHTKFNFQHLSRTYTTCPLNGNSPTQYQKHACITPTSKHCTMLADPLPCCPKLVQASRCLHEISNHGT